MCEANIITKYEGGGVNWLGISLMTPQHDTHQGVALNTLNNHVPGGTDLTWNSGAFARPKTTGLPSIRLWGSTQLKFPFSLRTGGVTR